jgi:transcriptional regulator with XRE-family HTH domain
MTVGKKIKQLRELRDYTQAHMAQQLNLSLGGYGKIERDETDISMSRLNQIAEILETTVPNILSFDSNTIFNQYNNTSANGIVQNQQIIADKGLHDFFMELKNEINDLKEQLNKRG